MSSLYALLPGCTMEEELPPEFKLFLPIQKDAAGAAPPAGP